MPIASLLLACSLAPLPRPDFPRKELAQEFLALSGQGDALPEDFDTARMAAGVFVGVHLGLFHLHIPVDSIQELDGPGEYPRAEEFKSIAESLLDLQEAWLEWLEPTSGSLRAVVKADLQRIDTVRAWVHSWTPRTLARRAANGGYDVLEALDPRESIRQACQELHTSMLQGTALGLERPSAGADFVAIPGEDYTGLALDEPLLLAPSRRDFLRMVSFAGWLLPEVGVFQDTAVAKWTNFYFNRYKVLATQYTKPFAGDGEEFVGIPMEHRLEPQITQLAALSLVDNYFGDRIPPAFAGAMAINLVVDVFGSCDTRVDGDLSERRTEAREMFVPGGLSQGGVLPKVSAESPWRKNHGADFFINALAVSQRQGKKETRRGFSEKVSHFQIFDYGQVASTIIHGPHLGLAADGRKGVEDVFLGELLEFQRSFRSAFLHWLSTEAGGSTKSSAKKLRQLLLDLAASEPNDFASVVEDVYGDPISAAVLDKKTVKYALEGRFLTWLSKVKVED